MTTPYESFHEEIEERDQRLEAVLLKLSNAVLAFFYEKGNMKLGTLAVAMPRFGEKTCISSILLGERNMVLTRILAERIASVSKGITLVSTHLPEVHEAGTSSALIKLTQKLLDKAGLK